VSEELIIDGQLASDIGYYSGLSVHDDGRESKFGGAYLIVWRKIDGVWRIHLDMWNAIK
jgi:ketosteroid isomerase-like protein